MDVMVAKLTHLQSTRLPYQGVSVSTEGQEHVPSVIGPMSRDLGSLIAVTKDVLDACPWDLDPKCSPIPWRSELYESIQSRPLVIAVIRDDGVVRPHPPVARVLQQVASKLEAAGHEIVPWSPGSLHQECIDIMVNHLPTLHYALTDLSAGPILYSRRLRRHPKRRRSRRRAIHTSCRNTCQQRQSNLRVRVLATQQAKASCTEALPRSLEFYKIDKDG